jgi:hypothetical protein
MLSEIAVKEFMEIYKERYGDELSFREGKEQATKLLQVFRVVFKPVNKNDNGR